MTHWTVIVRKIEGTRAIVEAETTTDFFAVEFGGQIERCELGERIAIPIAWFDVDGKIRKADPPAECLNLSRQSERLSF